MQTDPAGRAAQEGGKPPRPGLSVRLRDSAFAVLALGLRAVVRRLPPSGVSLVARAAERVVPWIAPRDRGVLRWNLEHVLGMDPDEPASRDFARSVVHHQVAASLESIRGVYDPASVVIEGLEELRSLMADNESHDLGQILITGHLGSWELTGRCCVEVAGRTFHALGKPPRNAGFDRALREFRERMGIRILWTDRPSLMRSMVQVLRDREWLSFVMDQRPEGRRGPVVEFLGRPTEFVSGPATMATRFDVPVIAAYCIREGPLRYRLETSQVLAPRHGEKDEADVTQLMAREIERAIRRHPEQWCWNYKRWPIA